MSDSSPPTFRLSLPVYRFLLRGYPSAFRRRFAPQMVEDFHEMLNQGRALGPLRGRIRAWIKTLLDLLVSVPREHFYARQNGESVNLSAPQKHSGNLMDSTLQDIRFALRTFRRRPLFFAVAVMTLGLGIGATTAIYSVVDAVLLEPLPFPEPQELMRPSLVMPPSPTGPMAPMAMLWSVPKSEVFKGGQEAFSATALYKGRGYTLTGDGEPARIRGEVVESAYLEIMEASATLGRVFTPEDDVPGAGSVVLLTHEFWLRRWGGDPSILGRTLTISGTPFTVVGVLPSGFRGLTGRAEIFLPFTFIDEADRVGAWNHSYFMIARLKEGVTPAQARAEMEGWGRRMEEAFPAPGHHQQGWGGTAERLDELRADPSLRSSILLLLGAVGFVLLIACVNLASLLLARGMGRRREIAVRVALGSGRARLVRQLMTESLVLAAGGAVVGLGVAFLGVRGLVSYGPTLQSVLPGDMNSLTILGLDRIAVDGTTLLFTLVVALATGVLFGLAPALNASKPDLNGELKVGSEWHHGSERFGGLSGRGALVVTELALTYVLLAGSGMMLKSYLNLQAVDTGFVPEKVLAAAVSLNPGSYGPGEREVFFPELYERVKAIPGVQSVGMNACAPLSGDGYCDTASIRFLDRPEVQEGAEPNVDFLRAGPGFFETVGVPLIRGRSFDWGDRSDEGRVAMVSAAAATEFWPGEDPIGKWVMLGGREAAEVVGIVGDVHYETLETQPKPAAYLASSQDGNYGGYLFVRVQGDPALLANEVRRTVGSMRPNIPAPGVWTLEAQVAGATARTRFSTSLLSLFAAVALAISAIGIFGVLSYLVSKQTRQIGIRMALGAQRGGIFRQVLRRALVMTGIGVGLGGLCYLGLMRFIQTLLFSVQPGDPITLAGIALTLSAVSMAAAYLPAWRATRVEPVEALKEG